MNHSIERLLARLLAALAIVAATAVPGTAAASEAGYPLDHFPNEKLTDLAALQNGAKLFVNYCLGCHGAQSMRYNRLQDLGLTDEQIKANLLFTADKVGEPMTIAMRASDAKTWFGALPPDLSVIARARGSGAGSGSDWLYTYLRAYYRDATRATGWNNALFENVGMPHALWQLQGNRGAQIEEIKTVVEGGKPSHRKTTVSFDAAGNRTEKAEAVHDAHAHDGRTIRLLKASGGTLDQSAYDDAVADLVAYLTYMSDPSAKFRLRLGVWVLLFLSLMMVAAWYLNKVYWKDVK